MIKYTALQMWRNKKYILGVISKTTLVTLLIFVVTAIGHTLSKQYENYIKTEVCLDYALRDLSKKELEAFHKNYDGSGKLVLTKSNLGFMTVGGGTGKLWLLAGDEEGLQKIRHISLLSGTFPKAPFEIAIEKQANDLLKKPYRIGDMIKGTVKGAILEDKEAHCTFKVTGFIENTGVMEDSFGKVAYGIVSLDTVSAVTKDLHIPHPYTVEIVVNEDLSVYDPEAVFADQFLAKSAICRDYSSLLKNYESLSPKDSKRLKRANSVVILNADKDRIFQSQTEEFTKSKNLLYLGGFMISLVGIILLFSGINTNFTSRIGEWGSLRAIGLSKHQVYESLFIEAFLSLLLGGGSGILFGVFFSNLVGAGFIQALYHVKSPVYFSFSGVILAFSMSGFAVFVSTLLLCRKISVMSPMEMMKFSDSKVKKQSRFRFKNIKVMIAARQITRRKITAITLFIILTVSNIFLSLIANTLFFIEWPKHDFGKTIGDFEVIQDFLGKSKPYFNEETLQKIKEIEGVKEVFALGNVISYTANIAGSGEEVSLYTYNDELFEEFLKETGLPKKSPEIPQAVSVGKVLKTGEFQVELRALDTPGKVIASSELPVKHHTALPFYEGRSDIRTDASGIVWVVNEAWAKSLYPKLCFNTFFISGNLPAERLVSLLSPILSEFSDYRYLSHDLSFSPELKSLLAMLSVLAALSGFIMVVLIDIEKQSVKTSLLLYRKEYAIYRAVGASLSDVKKIIRLEAVMTGGASALISVLFSVLLCMWISIQVFSEVKLSVGIFLVPMVNTALYTLITMFYARKLHTKSLYFYLKGAE